MRISVENLLVAKKCLFQKAVISCIKGYTSPIERDSPPPKKKILVSNMAGKSPRITHINLSLMITLTRTLKKGQVLCFFGIQSGR